MNHSDFIVRRLFQLFCFISEAQEQVTANLANFSYDPLNYEYLKESRAVELFLQLISSPNSNLTLHGIAGLCNLCLGKYFFLSIVSRIIFLSNHIFRFHRTRMPSDHYWCGRNYCHISITSSQFQ